MSGPVRLRASQQPILLLNQPRPWFYWSR